jgi:hypothetical protein
MTVFENMMLRKISGPNREEVREDWREILSEELHDRYYSPNIIRVST